MSKDQRIDPYKPIISERIGAPPIALRLVVTPSDSYVVGGSPTNSQRVETYVMLSVLPEELRKRVEMAIQALIAAG